MTDEDLDRIDAECARHVFGWKWVRARDCEWLDRDSLGSRSCMANRKRQGIAWLESPEATSDFTIPHDGSGKTVLNTEYKPLRGEDVGWGRPPKYTRSWSDAGEVVEKMRKNGLAVSAYMSNQDPYTYVTVYGTNMLPVVDNIDADTLPLAITLAALAAVGHPWKGTT